MKFTNITQGPKGLNADSGLVQVAPGETVDVEISDAEAKSANATGWFGKPKAEPLDHDGDGKKGGAAPAPAAKPYAKA